MDWTEGYYGELYLESVADLLTPALTALEADAIARLLRLGPGQRVLDLACGHGRHAWALAGRVGELVGVDRSGPYLRRAAAAPAGRGAPAARGSPRFARADVRALPFAEGCFDAVYSWYASLFMFDEGENVAALAQVAHVLRPGGRALVQHANPLRLERTPVERTRWALPAGGVVEEEAVFDAAAGVERAHRRLVRPDREVLAGTAVLRYYRPGEWGPLAHQAGLRLVELTSTTGAAARQRPEPGPDAPDLIALLEKP